MHTTAPILNRTSPYDVEAIREDFPILTKIVHGKPLAYLDNAATTQKPRSVIGRVQQYYENENSNIHRGVHYLSETATAAYEAARILVKDFIRARTEREIVFVRGTTEGINLVAHSFGAQVVTRGKEVLISAMEHHSNIVPWQILCEQNGADLRVIPMNDRGELLLDAYEKLLTENTAIVALAHASNALGTVNPVKQMIGLAHAKGIPVLLDGAQAVAHNPVNVQELDCDFYVFSAHKMYGPTGVGILYGKENLLSSMRPYQGGGDMIKSVTFEKTTYNDLPFKFEAGTPNIGGGIGLGAAIDYLQSVGLPRINTHETELLAYATSMLSEVEGLNIIGEAREKSCVLSFTLDGVHPHDIGTVLDREGIAIRTGHHCAQPVMQRFGIPATARASFGMYNTIGEIDRLVDGIRNVIKIMR